MPELPEVEAARQTAEEHLVNKTIVEANAIEDEKIFAGASPASLRSALVGKKVTAARRHGKNLWLELEGGGGGNDAEKGGKGGKAPEASSSSAPSSSSAALMLHFGMTGAFPVRGAKNVVYVSEGGGEAADEEADEKKAWPPRFCKLELSLSPGDARVAYCDPRRFGRVQVVAPASAVSERLPGGRDILNDPPSAEDLAAALEKINKGKPGRALKTVLMEQSFLAGVGNWVADEVLFAARIHPEARSGQLSQSQVARLSRALRSVAETACAARADSSLFPENWIFHERWDGGGDHRRTHEGHRISWIKVGGRTTAFCPAIQKKTDSDDGGEEGEEEEEEEETKKPKSKAAATAAAGKRKQAPKAAAPPPPPAAAATAKRSKKPVAVPKATKSARAAPSARAKALPRI